MYVHLGLDVLVKSEDIIGIFDLESSSISKHTRNFLKVSEEQKKIINVCTDIPKSFVVVKNKNNEEKVYITQISSSTIKKRNRVTIENGGHYVK